MAVLTWCLDQGAKQPAADVDAPFRRFAMRGVTAQLKAGSG